MDATEIISYIRITCQKRGVAGVKMLGKTFGLYDRDNSKRITFQEFKKCLFDFGCDELSPEDVATVFDHFDSNGEGSVDLTHFFNAIRPNMSQYRNDLAIRVFQQMDVENRGEITVSDIHDFFNVKKHPRYLSGEMTAREVFNRFLGELDASVEDIVTVDEWMDYYAGVSETIDKDVYFDFMMRQNWNL